MKTLALLLALVALAFSAFTLACVLPPQPITEIDEADSPAPDLLVPAGIDEQIFRSDIIVVASFLSAAAGVQTIPGGVGVRPTYRPMQVLTFRAVQYLQGTGPTIFTVEVLDTRSSIYNEGDLYEGYLSSDDAMTEARQLIAERNTTWDDRPGVLFLQGPLSSAASSTDTSGEASGASGESSSKNYGFALFNFWSDGDFAYSVDTDARAWLPASEASSGGVGGQSGTAGNSEYITDGAKSPPPVKTLTELKTRIAAIAAERAAGDGSEAYETCLYHKFRRDRAIRAGWTPAVFDLTIDSGMPSGTHLHQVDSLKTYDDPYNIYTQSGADAEMFQTIITDDDEDGSNGYYFDEATARPLPQGEYTANFHQQIGKDVICNHNPTDSNFIIYTVTVTAPAGTLHEAFFDPVTIGTAVGADATNGVLKPTAFTVGETATQMTSLKWENNQASLTLSPHASLSHYALVFIELDGSVSLTLLGTDATVDSTAGIHTWSVTDQPWHGGDNLMLRMREDATPPTTPTP